MMQKQPVESRGNLRFWFVTLLGVLKVPSLRACRGQSINAAVVPVVCPAGVVDLEFHLDKKWNEWSRCSWTPGTYPRPSKPTPA